LTVSLKIEPPENLAQISKVFKSDLGSGKLLQRELSVALRGIGDKMVDAERAAIMGLTIRGVKGSSRKGSERIRRGGKTKGSGKGIRGPMAAAVTRKNQFTGKGAGVEVRISGSKMAAINPGTNKIPTEANLGHFRHPVFGNRKTWAGQNVSPAYWWDKTRQAQRPMVEAEFKKVIEEFKAKANALLQ
jgi:hypothetical protein